MVALGSHGSVAHKTESYFSFKSGAIFSFFVVQLVITLLELLSFLLFDNSRGL